MANNPNRVDFDKPSFDQLVESKGHIMLRETAVRCSCNERHNGNAHSDCVNCGGIGFVFKVAKNIRGVIQNINFDPKTQQYNALEMGTATLTTKFEDRVAWMDRITVKDGESVFTETVYPTVQVQTGGTQVMRVRTLYPPIEITDAFFFVGTESAHTELTLNIDYTVSGNIITFSTAMRDALLSSGYEYAQIGLRYTHNPQYIVMDVNKDIRNTRELTTGSVEQLRKMVNNCMIKKTQYILNASGMPNVTDEN
jgi:hypothetical protein